MRTGELFIIIMSILLIFNWIYVSANPSIVNNMVFSLITSLIITAVTLTTLLGLKVLGTGVDTASIKIIFGISTLIQILFKLNFTILDRDCSMGLGLINNVFDAFSSGDLWGLGFFVSTVFSILALTSGLILIIGAGGG